jgi:hypothetical protein
MNENITADSLHYPRFKKNREKIIGKSTFLSIIPDYFTESQSLLRVKTLERMVFGRPHHV